MQFSVLMSLYSKERPEYLRQSLDSVFAQTLRPDEVVVVKDGPLTAELDAVLEDYAAAHPELKIVAFPENRGLGLALRDGLGHCSHEYVARMDTDDIAKPCRFERQLKWMAEHPEVAVCGTWMDEFSGSTGNVLSVKRTPECQAEIIRYAKGRNPVNHPSAMFRKSAVIGAGNYGDFPLFEDWHLWARMLVRGYEFHNLPESLMWFRVSPDVYKRRGGWKYACDEARFQIALLRLGLIGRAQAGKNIVTRFGVRIMPNFVRGFIYKKMLRN